MKALAKALARTLVIAACMLGSMVALFIGVFVFFFGWEGLTFGRKIAAIREEMFSKSPAELERIVQDARRLTEDPANRLDVDPKVFDYLAARRVVVSEERVWISLAFMMDTGADLTVSQDSDGSWILTGCFGERAPIEVLWPIEKRANKPVQINAVDAPRNSGAVIAISRSPRRV